VAPRLVILYEDAHGPLKRFPLHHLIVKSAADLVALEVHELLRRVVAVPKKAIIRVREGKAITRVREARKGCPWPRHPRAARRGPRRAQFRSAPV
jgi:hypothetical protein